MTSGICPKCNSSEVYRSEASPKSSDRVTLREGAFMGQDASSVTRFVCTGCGYLEYYLLQPADLQTIQKTWGRVQPS